MNKLRKVGLTALAGSLIASSVYAGEMSVTGAWSISYTSKDSDETTGNPFAMGDSLNFKGSGETDQGYAITVNLEVDGGNYDDQSLTMDMGDGGKVTFGHASVAGSGINAVSNIVPNANDSAYAWSGGAETIAYGVARGAAGTGNIGYDVTVGDLTVSAEYARDNGAETSLSIKYVGLIDGLEIVAGTGETDTADGNGGTDSTTVGIKYATGGLTFGYQKSEVDHLGTSETDEDGTHYGATFALNDNLSLGYGRQNVDFSGGSKTDEVNTAVTASYTAGSMTLKGYSAQTNDTGGTANSDDAQKGLSIAFSF